MAQYPGIPWNQRPDYVALTQRDDQAGIVTTYNPPRPGISATDVTSFVYGQATITLNNWPEIMYYLQPTAEWTAFRGTAQPPQKVDANGQGMVERFPHQGQPARPLLDFQILPDTICSQEEWWWIDLWRRMDPRMHWQDILMRIEVPNRTPDLDRHIQNTTNNLINRLAHRRYSMLAWHTTGANSMRNNEVRTLVLHRVNTAIPPLPHNSTRGLTPGLINPLLGNIPGNSVPHPPGRNNQGRLRVGIGRPRATQAAAAVANQAQGNLAQGNLVQNNRGRSNRERGHRTPSKRNRTSPDHTGRPTKRHAQDINFDTEDDNNMDTRSDRDKSSEDEPLSVAKARARVARTRKSGKPSFALGQVKTGAVKKKRHSQKPAMPKKTKQTTAHQQLKEAAQVQRDSTTEHDSEDETEIDERGDSSAAPLHFEGDPGFEAAFQASRRARRQAQDIEHAPRPPHRRGPPTLPSRRAPRGAVLDSELLGDENIEGRTLVAAPSSDTVTARQESAPPTPPSNAPTPAPRQRISAITGLPFAGQLRRQEALSGYGDSQFRRRGSPVRNSRVTPSTRNRTTEDNDGRAVLTSNSSAASIGLPVPPADRPHQSYYCPSPGGSHYQYTDNSGTPTSVTRPTPSSNSDGTIGANQRAPAQTTTQPPHPGPNVQPTARNPADAPNGQRSFAASNRMNRLTEVAARLFNAVDEERRRREQWPREVLGRHARGVLDVMMDGDTEWATGFLERELERERRERQPSSDDE